MKKRIAPEGCWLTQATLNEDESRFFARKACGFGNLKERFILWTDEQKEQWEAEHPQPAQEG